VLAALNMETIVTIRKPAIAPNAGAATLKSLKG
jgi:hypothetical protein